MAEFVTVAKVDAIPVGQGDAFQVGDRLIAVFHLEEGFFAIDDACPHMGASLGAGAVDDDGEVVCPWHAWRFNVKDGRWCDSPSLGVNCYHVRVVGDEIQVCPDEVGGDAED